MPKYKMQIIEKLVKQVEIIANSEEEAVEKTWEAYDKGEIVLYPENHIETEIYMVEELK